MANLRWKVIAIVLITLIFGSVSIDPMVAARYGMTSPKLLPDRLRKLGLDLKGGVNLVLRVAVHANFHLLPSYTTHCSERRDPSAFSTTRMS